MLQSLLSAEAELFVLFAVEAFRFRLANLPGAAADRKLLTIRNLILS